MASVQDIRRRIRSITNTRKITRAMELVAAAKLRKAQTRIEDMRPYADRMLELMAGTARASASVRGLPLLQQRDEVRSVAVVPVMGDRGLSGAFNSQVLRRALAVNRQLQGEGKQVRWVAVGRLQARRPDDRDAERVEERRRPDRQPDPRHEPRPPGRDHPGDPRSGCGRGRLDGLTYRDTAGDSP